MAVFKDKNGTWNYEFTHIDSFGNVQRQHRRSIKWKLKRDAIAAMETHKAKLSKDPTNLTYEILYKLYIEDRKERIKKKSIYNIDKLNDKHIMPYFGKVKMSKITPRMIQEWQSKLMNEGYSNKYLVKIQEQFRTVINFGIKYDYITYNPFKIELARVPSQHKKEIQFWTQDEYAKFINVIEDPIYVCLFSILYWTGIRIGELQALQWTDFNGSTLNIRKTFDSVHHIITTPKTSNSYRHVRLTQSIVEQLNSLRLFYADTYEFSSECFIFGIDKPLAPNTIRNRFNKYIELARVHKIRVHDFRHSHVSLLINLGFDRFEIAKRLGHTPNMVDNTYSHWFESAQIDMVNKLDQISANLEKKTENPTHFPPKVN